MRSVVHDSDSEKTLALAQDCHSKSKGFCDRSTGSGRTPEGPTVSRLRDKVQRRAVEHHKMQDMVTPTDMQQLADQLSDRHTHSRRTVEIWDDDSNHNQNRSAQQHRNSNASFIDECSKWSQAVRERRVVHDSDFANASHTDTWMVGHCDGAASAHLRNLRGRTERSASLDSSRYMSDRKGRIES